MKDNYRLEKRYRIVYLGKTVLETDIHDKKTALNHIIYIMNDNSDSRIEDYTVEVYYCITNGDER